MPEEGPATTVVETVEKPPEAVAATMDDAADTVSEAAEQAAEAGLDGLANRLSALETELRGHLQHPHGSEGVAASETVATPVAAEAVEVEVPEPVVKPKKLHPYQRARFL